MSEQTQSETAAQDTPKAMNGTWTLTAPDGRVWQADSPLRCCGMESRERYAQIAGLGSTEGLGAWLPIATAPRDGTTFLAARFVPGKDAPEYELGAYDPTRWTEYVPTDDGSGLFRRVDRVIYEWSGFNNFGRMTHWAHLPALPLSA